MKRIITISREFGSGGHEIGEKLAERLGYAFYDRNLISKVADKTLLPEGVIADKDEASGDLFRDFFSGSETGLDNYIINEQRKLILELADKGGCVIVGRCADWFLRDRGQDVLRVFIYADRKDRNLRIIDRRPEMNPDDVPDFIRHMDKKRSMHYHYCTDAVWGDRRNYDIMLNTSKTGIAGAVNILAGIAQE